MKYKITDITNFINTVPCKTIMEAALKLGISQPALSESLKRLEIDIGFKLFYRSRTGIKLTPNGSLYLEKAKIAINTLEELHTQGESSSLFKQSKIKLGCHPLVAQYTLPLVFKNIKKVAPDFNYELIHGPSRDIQFEIQRGNIDIGIVINPSKVPDLIITKLAKDRVGIWHDTETKKLTTMYCDLNLFQTHSILKKLKEPPKKIISSQSLELIIQFTKNGLGMGIIPERVMKLYAPKLQLLEGAPIYQDEISLVYRPEFGKNEAEKLTIDTIKNSLSEIKKRLTTKRL